MKVLNAYILREFLKILAITVISFISIYLIVDIFELVDDFIEKGVPLSISARFFIYKLPAILYQISPIAVLMATIITIGILSKHSEITAIKASGISVFRCILPIVWCGLIFSLINIFVNEAIAPLTNREMNEIKSTWLETGKANTFNREGLWYRYPGGIYNIRLLDRKKNIIQGLSIYEVDRSFTPVKKIYSDRVEKTDIGWEITSGTVSTFGQDGTAETNTISRLPLREISEDLENIGSSETHPEEMSFMELYRYVKRLRESGFDAGRYTVDLHNKLSFPMVNLIMVLIGIPFSLKGERRGGLALGVVATILIGFSYWLVFAVNTSLGHSGIFPPVFAAWFTDIIFCSVGLLMLSYARH